MTGGGQSAPASVSRAERFGVTSRSKGTPHIHFSVDAASIVGSAGMLSYQAATSAVCSLVSGLQPAETSPIVLAGSVYATSRHLAERLRCTMMG